MGLTKVSTDGVKDDAVTTDKLANAINTERTANTAKVSTTINSNADNRVITGSGTANTLNGESLVTIDSNGRLSVEPNAGGSGITLASAGSTFGGIVKLRNTAGSNHDWIIGVGGGDGAYVAGRGLLIRDETTGANRIAIDTSGNVGIGTTTPQGGGLTVENSSEARVQVRAGSNGSNGILALRADGSNTQLGTWSNHDLKIVRNNSIKASFTSDGLCFNSDTAAANALDDYEQGNFTPDWRGASALGTTSYGFNEGSYVKIGNQVTVRGFSEIQGSSGGSGFWFINNMPFTVAADRRHRSVGSISLEAFDLPSDVVDTVAFMDRNNNDMHLRGTRDALSPSTGISVNSDTSWQIIFTITYQTT